MDDESVTVVVVGNQILETNTIIKPNFLGHTPREQDSDNNLHFSHEIHKHKFKCASSADMGELLGHIRSVELFFNPACRT